MSIFRSFAKPKEVPVHVEALTPIDEEAAEDVDDMPITMIPKIVQTAPSPSSEQTPPLSNITSTTTVGQTPQRSSADEPKKKKEINQIESVL